MKEAHFCRKWYIKGLLGSPPRPGRSSHKKYEIVHLKPYSFKEVYCLDYYFQPICIPFIAGGTCFKYLSACSEL